MSIAQIEMNEFPFPVETIQEHLREKEEKLARTGSSAEAEPLRRSTTDTEVDRNWGIEETIKFLKESTELGKSSRFDENFDENFD